MEIIAINKSVRISPRKVRLMVDSLNTDSPKLVLDKLSNLQKRAVLPIVKTLKSAIANATNNAKLPLESLRIKNIDVQEGPALKRFHPSTRGRVHPYKKRSSHIRVVLEEKPSFTKVVTEAEPAGKGGKK